jgi:hypothetical protein
MSNTDQHRLHRTFNEGGFSTLLLDVETSGPDGGDGSSTKLTLTDGGTMAWSAHVERFSGTPSSVMVEVSGDSEALNLAAVLESAAVFLRAVWGTGQVPYTT